MPAVHSKSLLPIPLSKEAFEVLTRNDITRSMPETNDPEFPEIIFTASPCGRFSSFIDGEKRLAIVNVYPVLGRHEGYQVVAFYKRTLSNFSRLNGAMDWMINGKIVDWIVCERLFKAACVGLHMDPKDETSPKAHHLLNVLESVMSSVSPLECKLATRAIEKQDFEFQKWDDISSEVMYKGQLWKFTDPVFYNFAQLLASEAVKLSIPPRNCYFMEAAESKDMLWGNGMSVEGVFRDVIENLSNDKWTKPTVEPLPFFGLNELGHAINLAYLKVIGESGENIGKPVEDYRALYKDVEWGLFTYSPPSDEGSPAKRARTLSSTEDSSLADEQEDLEGSSSVSLGRTCSAD